MKTRSGITLIEVLVAIFIMSIGLLALLTLFPLGALSMAAALKDQRDSEASQQATALANSMNLRTDPAVVGLFSAPANTTGASGPVFVDPWGQQIYALTPQATLLGLPGPTIPRTSPSYATNNPTATMLFFALQDEMTFLNNGLPNTTTQAFQREPVTTWAYWLRRPNNAIPNVVELSVVVYSNRNIQLGSTETPTTNLLSASGTPSAVAVPMAGTDVRRNMWIVDVTPDVNGVPVGNWYRVVGADDTVVNTAGGPVNSVQLELQPVPQTVIKNIIIMQDVAEVFPKGTGWK